MIKLFENFKFYKKGMNITYSAVILNQESVNLLLNTFIYSNPEYTDWIKLANHSTICLGELPEHLKRYWLNEEVTLTAIELGTSDKAIAVKVIGFFNIEKPGLEDGPKFQHITLAINPTDAKPANSNDITNWKTIPHLKLRGTVKEVVR